MNFVTHLCLISEWDIRCSDLRAHRRRVGLQLKIITRSWKRNVS